MDHIYRVGIEFTVGSLDAQIRAATSRVPMGALFGGDRGRREASELKQTFSSLKDAAGEVGTRLSSAFEGAVEKAGALAMTMGKLGIGAAVGAAAYGVAGLNNELEQTQLSLAAIFNANGLTKNFADAMTVSSDQVAKMKQDIKTLPGTLGELSGIMSTIAGPGASAGMSSDRIRKLAETAMLSGRVMLGQRYSASLVSRELGDLLTGRVTSQNVLARNMGLHGDEAKKYKSLSPEKQVEYLEKNFDRFAPAAAAFAQSYVAIWTTFIDNVKYGFLAPATSPLFESVKNTLKGANKWFDENPDKVQQWAGLIGIRLRNAFEWGVEKAKEWGPVVMQFMEDAYGRVQNLWAKFGPMVMETAEALKNALSNGEALDKIESILKLYVALKIGGMVGPVASAGFSAISGGVSSMIGGGGAAGIGATAIGGMGAGLGTAVLGAGAVLGAAVVGGEMLALADGSKEAKDAAKKVGSELDDLAISLGPVKSFFEWFGTEGTQEFAKFLNGLHMIKATEEVYDKFDTDQDENTARWLADPRNKNSDLGYERVKKDFETKRAIRRYNQSLADDTFTPKREFDVDAYTNRFSALHEMTAEQQAKKTTKNGNGVHIEHLDMNISGSDDPSRVARNVMRKLAEVARYPTSSRYAPNILSGRT